MSAHDKMVRARHDKTVHARHDKTVHARHDKTGVQCEKGAHTGAPLRGLGIDRCSSVKGFAGIDIGTLAFQDGFKGRQEEDHVPSA